MRIGDFDHRGVTRTAKNEEPASTARAGDNAKPAGAPPEAGVLIKLGTAASAVFQASQAPNTPDQARVNEILDRIRSGDYKVDFERLAGKMLSEEIRRGRRHK
ncbi:MAG: flagellar biosynthesis anti-sigma factor FlgM [Deltaproteobacteria bacterium]|nr:flagellar biosynthesis anti-sigma factor FlgM [Deltaproteobacteria bacterium]